MRPLENGAKPQLTAEIRKIFTDAATSFPGDFTKQAQLIVAAHRPAGLPERFQPKLMGQWDDLIEKYKQQKRAQEAARQNEAQQQANRELIERRNQERYAQMGRESCRELEQLFRQKEFDKLISRAWGISNPSIEHEPNVWFSGDINVERNNSKVFISRSYPATLVVHGDSYSTYDKRTFSTSSYSSSYSKEVTQVDKAGIRYEDLFFHPKYGVSGTLGATQESIEQYKGVKVYFVNNDIVPIEHPDARRIFFEYVMAAEERKKREEVK